VKNNDILKRAIKDFKFFASLIKIPAVDFHLPPGESEAKMRPFILAKFQEEYVEFLEAKKPITKVINKSRQIGITTTTLAYILWKMLYSSNEKILYIIDRLEKATEITRKINAMYDTLPKSIKPSVEFTAQKITCRNNIFFSQTASSNTGRSDSFTQTYFDEVAWVEPRIQKDILSGLTSSSPNCRVFFSTPRVENDLFHLLVEAAREDGTLFERTFKSDIVKVQWFGSVENADIWIRQISKNLTPGMIARELMGEFKGVADNLIWHTEDTFFMSPQELVYYPVNCASLDIGWVDDTAILFGYHNKREQKIYILKEVVVNKTTIIDIYNTYMKNYKFDWIAMDSSGKKVDITNSLSPYSQLSSLCKCPVYTRKRDRFEMVDITQRLLMTDKIKISTDCKELIRMLNNYELDSKENFPRNDLKHINDAFVYMGLNFSVNLLNHQAYEQVNRNKIKQFLYRHN